MRVPKVNELSFDPDRRVASIKGKPLDLRPKEVDLLALLMQQRGRVLTKEAITDASWKSEAI